MGGVGIGEREEGVVRQRIAASVKRAVGHARVKVAWAIQANRRAMSADIVQGMWQASDGDDNVEGHPGWIRSTLTCRRWRIRRCWGRHVPVWTVRPEDKSIVGTRGPVGVNVVVGLIDAVGVSLKERKQGGGGKKKKRQSINQSIDRNNERKNDMNRLTVSIRPYRSHRVSRRHPRSGWYGRLRIWVRQG